MEAIKFWDVANFMLRATLVLKPVKSPPRFSWYQSSVSTSTNARDPGSVDYFYEIFRGINLTKYGHIACKSPQDTKVCPQRKFAKANI